MKIAKLFLFVAAGLLFVSCSRKPDVIFVNGKVYTLDKNNSIAEAIAVKDGKILATGKTQEFKEKYSSVEIIDLKGKTVVPGFIDAEGNLMEYSRNLNFIDLRNTKTLKEILDKVHERIITAHEGEWLGGFGWDDLILSESDYKRLSHQLLDSIASKQKVYLLNSRADIVWVNKNMLDAANITRNTPDPPGGEIEKDEKNEPTGLLFDAAQELIIKILPEPSEPQVIENVQNGIKELFRYGITEINDANISEPNLNVYKKMVDENKFPIRLYAMLSGKGPLFEKYIKSGPENYKDRIHVKCMYLEYDGYFEDQNAAMVDDYSKEPRRMTPYNDEFDLKEMMKNSFKSDFQVSIKAVGDRAVTSTLNAFESVYNEMKPKTGRNRIEYAEFVLSQDMQRIKQLEIIPSVRPEVTLEDKAVLPEIINPDNGKNLGLWSTLLKQNERIICGTDFPYHQINPLVQMYILSSGLGFDTTANRLYNNISQKLTVSDALKSFTIWSAYACFQDDVKGTIEPGKFADFVVLSEDILVSDPKVLLDTKILMTVVGGEVVYELKLEAAGLN
jgi:predicted amidohydrolase YtcJ